jgi:hypothetical protein
MTSSRSNDICQVLTDTLSSLSADAAALRQLASLASHVGVTEDGQVNESVFGRLCDLDSAVSGLESKMKLMREIVNQEKKAVDDLESLSEESQRQRERLKVVVHALEVQKENEALDFPRGKLPVVTSNNNSNNLHEKLASRNDSNSNHIHEKLTSPNGSNRNNLHEKLASRNEARRDSMNPCSSQSPSHNDSNSRNLHEKLASHNEARRDSVNPCSSQSQSQSPAHHQIHLRRVTRAELQSLPRTVRGRISLSVVNDAVIEIEYVCRTKYTLLVRNRRKQMQHTISQSTEEEPSDEPWVSEQELRQSCAFFRVGESTARTVLSILRSLNRLKQLPSKTGDIIYVCSA